MCMFLLLQCCDGSCPRCELQCNKTLGCRNHKCASPCHTGPCYPCPLTVEIKCTCGATSITVPCGREKTTNPPKCRKPCRYGNLSGIFFFCFFVCDHVKFIFGISFTKKNLILFEGTNTLLFCVFNVKTDQLQLQWGTCSSKFNSQEAWKLYTL